MSSTRSPFLPAPATDVLIVSHGSPSKPDPQERFVQQLAERVAQVSGAVVRGATLAMPGALEAAVDSMSTPLVFPHFMADGWFVSTNLQERLAKTRLSGWMTLPPLGLASGLPELALRRLASELRAQDLPKGKTVLIVAAHGSPSDPRPARATETFARALQTSGVFSAVRLGYVDEEPSLVSAASLTGPAIVLPFFAARAGHVLMDLPGALDEANFTGPVLPPIGTWSEIPQMIAALLKNKAMAA